MRGRIVVYFVQMLSLAAKFRIIDFVNFDFQYFSLQPLIIRRKDLLEPNFDASLFTLMKESRNLKLLGFKDMPEGCVWRGHITGELYKIYRVSSLSVLKFTAHVSFCCWRRN